MAFQDYQQSLKWMAKTSNKNNLMTGKIFIIRDNDRYDCVILGDQNVVMPNLLPANPRETYNIGDEVFIGLPWGSLSILRILMRSNTSIPPEKVFTFRTKPAVSENIYLTCPDESKIKVYSLDGTLRRYITVGTNKINFICTDGIYLYTGLFPSALKVKPDGSDLHIINTDVSASYTSGLFVHADYDYLYSSGSFYINRLSIEDGLVDYSWVEFPPDAHLGGSGGCGNHDYIFAVKIYGASIHYIYKIDYGGNVNDEFFATIGAVYAHELGRIKADENFVYILEYPNGSYLRKYSLSGNLEFTVNLGETANCLAVNNGEVYVVTATKVKKYNSSGEFQSEFDISGTITDAVII